MVTYYPLSNTQRLLLSEQLQDVQSPHMNIGGYFVVEGILDLDTYKKALSKVISTNDILRTFFVVNNKGEYQQEVKNSVELALLVKNVANTEYDEEYVAEFVEKRMQRPFNLLNEQPYQFGVLVSEDRTFCYSIYNHLVADGWSVALAAKKIVSNYNSLIGNESISNVEEISYFEVLDKDEAYSQSEKYLSDKKYWNDKASKFGDFQWNIAGKQRYKNVSTSFTKKAALTEPQLCRIREYCVKNNTHTFHFYLAVIFLILKNRTQHDKLLMNIRLQNRSGKRQKSSLGAFSNVSPLLLDLSVNSINELFKSISSELKDSYKHQKCSWKEFYGSPELGVDGIKDSIVLSYEPHDHNYIVDGQETRTQNIHNGMVKSLLDIYIREFRIGSGAEVCFNFDLDLFGEIEGSIIVQQFSLLIDQIIYQGKEKLNELNFLSKIEQEIFINMNNTDTLLLKDNLCSVLDDVFYKFPNDLAVVCDRDQLLYSELAMKANRFAGFLQSKGVSVNDRIAVKLDYSCDMVVAMTAIIIVGATFVPISIDEPLNRADKMLEDSKVQYIIADSLENFFVEKITLSQLNSYTDSFKKPIDNFDELLSLYIVYTSGSTGNPKGVINTHRAAVNVLEEWIDKYKIVIENFVLLQTSSFAHDVFIGNFLKTIATGGTLVLPTSEERHDFSQLSELIVEHRVNALDSTPSLVVALLDYMKSHAVDDSSLKLIVLGSDICSLEDYRKLVIRYKDQAMVLNSYGVSEAAIYSSDYRVLEVDQLPMNGNLSIGRPFRNTKMYVINEKLEQVGIGCKGELCIYGHGLAAGYTDEELTNNSFIELQGIGRVYRTGDLAKVLTDGNIEFIGRKDFQIKMLGYRIEPGEIESVLDSMPKVSKVIVVVSEFEGKRILIAYYISEGLIERNDFLSLLSGVVPNYMIPSFFIRLDELPITKNGKIDRKLLMQRPLEKKTVQENQVTKQSEDKKNIQNIWNKVLGNRFSPDKLFFEMAGDSLEAIRIASEMNASGYACSYLDVYNSKSFEEFYNLIIVVPKIDSLLQANRFLAQRFEDDVQLVKLHNSKLGVAIIELQLPKNKLAVDVQVIFQFCKMRFSLDINPQYIAGKEYETLGSSSTKKLLNEFVNMEKMYFQSLVGLQSTEYIQHPLYYKDFKKYYRNVYFVSRLKIDFDKIEDIKLAVNSLLKNNDLLRSRLKQESLGSYRWEVFPVDYAEVPVLDLTSLDLFSSYDFLYTVMGEYFIKKNEFRKFMFRVVIVKLNMRDAFLWYFMDDSIHDNYGSHLIEHYLSSVSDYGYKDYSSCTNYSDYLSKYFHSNSDNTPTDLVQKMELMEHQEATNQYKDFIKKNTKNKEVSKFRYTFKVENSFNDFSLAIEAFICFVTHHFPFSKIPFVLLHNTRLYSPETLMTSIGAFIDEIPLMIDAKLSVEQNIELIKYKLDYVNENGIHFQNLLLNPDLQGAPGQKQVKNIAGDLRKTSSLLLFNFKQGDIQMEELDSGSDSAIKRWLYGLSFNISIIDGVCELYIRFPYKVNEDKLKEVFDRRFENV